MASPTQHTLAVRGLPAQVDVIAGAGRTHPSVLGVAWDAGIRSWLPAMVCEIECIGVAWAEKACKKQTNTYHVVQVRALIMFIITDDDHILKNCSVLELRALRFSAGAPPLQTTTPNTPALLQSLMRGWSLPLPPHSLCYLSMCGGHWVKQSPLVALCVVDVVCEMCFPRRSVNV